MGTNWAQRVEDAVSMSSEPFRPNRKEVQLPLLPDNLTWMIENLHQQIGPKYFVNLKDKTVKKSFNLILKSKTGADLLPLKK